MGFFSFEFLPGIIRHKIHNLTAVIDLYIDVIVIFKYKLCM